VRRALEDAGRDPWSFSFTIFAAPTEERTMEWAHDAGVHRVLFGIESNPPQNVLEDLEAAADFADRHR
jgi:hypothetical protein